MDPGPSFSRPLHRDLRGNKMTELTPGSAGACPGCCVVKAVLSRVLSRGGAREDEEKGRSRTSDALRFYVWT